MPSTTYTVLVTVAHDPGAAPSTDLLQAMIERGLEEGVRDMAGLSAVSASAVVGDHLGNWPLSAALRGEIAKVRSLHVELRKE